VADYDSTTDTLAHQQRVRELALPLIAELMFRVCRHDDSKLFHPEKGIFDEFTPKLKTSTYGSPEYKGFLAEMGAGLAHHYQVNRHHPEHFPDGINGMTLIDLLEMLIDWEAATERHANGNLANSLVVQQNRFGISDQLYRILRNTAELYGWIPPYGEAS